MSRSIKLGRIGGIQIEVDWTWFLAVLFFTWALGDEYHVMFKSWSPSTDYIVGFISAVLLFFTVLVHELSHSFTAKAEGLPVNKISLFIFGGISNLAREPESGRTELLVAIAGPLAF
jgi:Zn-dependent protease